MLDVTAYQIYSLTWLSRLLPGMFASITSSLVHYLVARAPGEWELAIGKSQDILKENHVHGRSIHRWEHIELMLCEVTACLYSVNSE